VSSSLRERMHERRSFVNWSTTSQFFAPKRNGVFAHNSLPVFRDQSEPADGASPIEGGDGRPCCADLQPADKLEQFRAFVTLVADPTPGDKKPPSDNQQSVPSLNDKRLISTSQDRARRPRHTANGLNPCAAPRVCEKQDLAPLPVVSPALTSAGSGGLW
jgi:hypothetical protein